MKHLFVFILGSTFKSQLTIDRTDVNAAGFYKCKIAYKDYGVVYSPDIAVPVFRM